MCRPTQECLYSTHLGDNTLRRRVNIPPLSELIKERRIIFDGDCFRSKDEIVGNILLWKPKYGRRLDGRPLKTYMDRLINDVDTPANEI